MAVTLEVVRHIAALARLGLSDERAHAMVAELNTILAHMEVLSKVDVRRLESVIAGGSDASGLPLRPDAGPPIPLERALDELAPRMQDGFFLVPRLSTHEDPNAAS